uniref:Uncharacterized protein n=1 Tax=Mesocestoides corti TaxID=53468 RepID=A0A5K3FFG4_MESCO
MSLGCDIRSMLVDSEPHPHCQLILAVSRKVLLFNELTPIYPANVSSQDFVRHSCCYNRTLNVG